MGGRLLSAAEESKRRFFRPGARGRLFSFAAGRLRSFALRPGCRPRGSGAAVEKDGLAVGFRMQRGAKRGGQAPRPARPFQDFHLLRAEVLRQSCSAPEQALTALTSAHSARISDAISRSISSTCGA